MDNGSRRQKQQGELLRTTTPRRVAIVHNPEPFEAVDLCRGVASYRPQGGPWQLLTIPRERPTEGMAGRLDELDCHGVIMMPGIPRLLDRLVARGICVVDVDGGAPLGRYCQVRLDNPHIGQVGARHLAGRGFSRLLYVGIDTGWSRDRARGFSAAAAEHGVEHKLVFAPSWTEVASASWILRALQTLPHPLGVMACNDQVAAGVVEVVCGRGWDVATRVAVLGVDDRFLECTRLPVPLSSISTERYRAGAEAARLLDALFAGEGAGGEPVWIRPDKVVERQSTSAHVYGDPDIGTALDFIRARVGDGITVTDVVEHVSVSRSTLDRRFRQLLGRLPGEEIRRVRLERTKQLLEQTHLPLAQIAAACGFSSPSSLSHCFRSVTGLSPDRYRQQARAQS